ncbi:rhoGEF domain-containing protein gxcI-like [Neodiprion virginianus]|uniref:rhoGEF domain-containing protein gxcI-like n=1 Tax=Neodiprion virginianus TaxID=2961670 RepID=UPI001EE6A49C|nr:rhoGEF domain-containing protein gxcI-like [Neodiprion virginianus]XP_046628292.1 rhoGEF domain-containing protein gxcI-like [Neodiprion virginianus]
MGGPGAGRATRQELNIVPHHVGHGERVLVIGESPATACRCCPPATTPPPVTALPSPPPLALLHIYGISSSNNNNNNKNNNNNNNNNAEATVEETAKAAMSSPPKHRRGFDPNDATANDFRRYRRVKTRQRAIPCPLRSSRECVPRIPPG